MFIYKHEKKWEDTDCIHHRIVEIHPVVLLIVVALITVGMYYVLV